MIRQLTQRHPQVPRDQVVKSIFAARGATAPSEGRRRYITDAARRIEKLK